MLRLLDLVAYAIDSQRHTVVANLLPAAERPEVVRRRLAAAPFEICFYGGKEGAAHKY